MLETPPKENLAYVVLQIKEQLNRKRVCAGGVIYDSIGKKLLVVRGKLKWSLPKGHQEIGESIRDTAVREIFEETSIKVSIEKENRPIRLLKCSYYFIHIDNGSISTTPLLPIDKNEVYEVKWCTKEQLQLYDCNKQLRYLLRNWNTMMMKMFNNVCN